MEIVKNLKDDEMLIQAWKELCDAFTLHPITMQPIIMQSVDMNEGTVHLYQEDFERLLELAEIGKNVVQGINCEVVENKREEDAGHSEEQPDPHFKYNDKKGTYDCSQCLCHTCISYKGEQVEACAETCSNITCHNDYYVDSCPAYNDGHNF